MFCATGADSLLTICFWKMGIAMTDPDPLWHPEGMTMFDPVPHPYDADEHTLPRAAHALGNLLRHSAGACSGLCEVRSSGMA